MAWLIPSPITSAPGTLPAVVLFNVNPPELTVVVPEYVLAALPENVTLPIAASLIVKPPLPLIAPLKVSDCPPVTVTVPPRITALLNVAPIGDACTVVPAPIVSVPVPAGDAPPSNKRPWFMVNPPANVLLPESRIVPKPFCVMLPLDRLDATSRSIPDDVFPGPTVNVVVPFKLIGLLIDAVLVLELVVTVPVFKPKVKLPAVRTAPSIGP